MSTARRFAAASLIVAVPFLIACGGAASTVSQGVSAAQSAASQAASIASSAAAANASDTPTPAASSPESSAPATASSPAPAAGSLCDAVGELKNMSDKPSSKDVDTLKQAAADIRADAPAEVAKGAASYAVILEALAASLENNQTGANMGAAIAKGMTKDPKDITAFITYVATTCK